MENGSQDYMPECMKLQPERYFHVTDMSGGVAKGNPEPIGRALVARLKDNQFLVTGGRLV